MHRKELTTEEKWASVDRILKEIDCRKIAGLTPYKNDLYQYIDYTFNLPTEE